jgi:hypothetical protein
MSTTQETKIDWSKPVQTKETPPRKVRILTTEAAGDYPVVGNIDGDNMYRTWKMDGIMYHSIPSERDIENTPAWKLPDPPANQQWQRNDWVAEMLPAGYRPLLLGEAMVDGDEYGDAYKLPDGSPPHRWSTFPGLRSTTTHMRTKRPLPQPVDPWAAEKAAFAAGETIQHKPILHPDVAWKNTSVPIWADDSIYRIKPKPQKVPLEPCDVIPGSVIRLQEGNWKMILGVTSEGVHTLEHGLVGYSALNNSLWQIKRPTDTEWQPCYKEVLP